MTKRSALIAAMVCAVVPLVVAAVTITNAPEADACTTSLAYAEISNGRGGTNVEAVVYTKEMGFNKRRSLRAFEDTVYPLLSTHCSGIHSTERTHASAAQAPVHSDVDVSLAHEYALTRVNFREPESSRLVVRLGIERHNCFLGSCETSPKSMLDAVTAWRDAVADMIPEVPRGVAAATKIDERQILEWIDADKAAIPETEREFIQYASLHVLLAASFIRMWPLPQARA